MKTEDELYALMCENWGGTAYSTEVLCIFKNEALAQRAAKLWQGSTPTCDVRYFVEAVEFNNSEEE